MLPKLLWVNCFVSNSYGGGTKVSYTRQVEYFIFLSELNTICRKNELCYTENFKFITDAFRMIYLLMHIRFFCLDN